MNKNAIIALVVVIVALGAFYYWKSSKKPVQDQTEDAVIVETVSPQVAPGANPLKGTASASDINPIEKANPFNSYENPFK